MQRTGSFCPALIADIVAYMSGVRIQQQTADRVDRMDEELSEVVKIKYLPDNDARNMLQTILGNKEMVNKVISVFRMLAENPTKGEGKLYITLQSLTKGFVITFPLTLF